MLVDSTDIFSMNWLIQRVTAQRTATAGALTLN